MNSAPAQFEDIKLLEAKLASSQIPQDLRQKANLLIDRLARLASSPQASQEYDSIERYLDWITALPWQKRTPETLSIDRAKKTLDSTHFGLDNIKERILEYISVASLKKTQASQPNPPAEGRAPLILLVGLVGTGKTSIASSIATALGRTFGRIPMGGMGDARELRGKPRTTQDAEPGQIIKILRRVQAKNPVILLDEIDRVTHEVEGDIMGVLVELLDPEQNRNFLDHYIDYPFDLSEVFFITTANNTANIATAVLDRLEILEMPSYSDEQKITIGKNYLLPREMTAAGLTAKDLKIEDSTWPLIVRPLGFDAGMRTLDRTIAAVCRKIAKLKVEGKISGVTIAETNFKEYIS